MTTTAPQFLPWLRTGLATAIGSPAVTGLAPTDSATASVAVQLKSIGDDGELIEPIAGPAVRLLGPADVVGLDPAQILRQDPEPGAADAEANYFALVELASADLPWRFTPAAPDADGRLQPWLALVVVEEREGVSLQDRGPSLRPVLHVDSAEEELPDLAQCWAWAHVQAEHDLAAGVAAAYAESPDLFRARLICPRRLPPQRAWLACVVPTFEAGRRAALGEPGGVNLGPAWLPTSVDLSLPVYHHWRFQTGEKGDFESLVRRLKPRELPATVGRRDLDIGEPGSGLPNAPGTLVTYSGALVSPTSSERVWPAEHRDATKEALRRKLNQLLAPAGETPADYCALRDDPIVGPPAYAARQAKRRRVPAEGKPPLWFEELNTEPHLRATAGLGAEVVRHDQEAMLAAAWQFAAEQVDVNRLLGRARLGWELARKAQPRFSTLSDATLYQIASPALPRLRNPAGKTLFGALAETAVPTGLSSGAFRRLTRTTKALARTDAVVSAALTDPISFSASWTTTRVPLGADLQGSITTSSIAAGAAWAADEATAVLRPRMPGSGGDDDEPTAMLWLGASAARADAAQTIRLDVPGLGERNPGNAASRTASPRRGEPTVAAAGVGSVGSATVTLAEAAHRPMVLGQTTIAVPVGGPADSITSDIRDALDPQATIVKMVETRAVGLPSDREHDVPHRIWVRPQFTTPMYERLRALSVDYLVPGIGDIPDNTLGLLLANREFVESFLAGLNHELGRELIWREYPARPSATWCQQFFDSGPDGPADIKVIGAWNGDEGLGANRPEGTAAADLVLLIKGALPRRYPDLRVYAVEAAWVDGKRREAVGGEVRFPAFSGQLQRDTHFYGFALTQQAARGSKVEPNHPGWFFVLEERPRAPRFGLDAPRPRLRGIAPARWPDLSWAHLVEAEADLPSFVDTASPPWLLDAGALRGNGGPDAWGEDSAAMARITLQRPIRMLTHADSMLPPPTGWQGAPIGDILDDLLDGTPGGGPRPGSPGGPLTGGFPTHGTIGGRSR